MEVAATRLGDKMGLAFYDSDQQPYALNDVFRSFHDGYRGDVFEQLIYIKNDDVSRYYTNLVLSYENTVYSDDGEFGFSGWGTKFLYGQRRPTEAEWDLVRTGDLFRLPDIGTTTVADTSTYHPVWIRIACPGDQMAQIRENQTLRLTFLPRLVGA